MTSTQPDTQPVTEPVPEPVPEPVTERDAGFTLLEYTVAMAIFAIVISITAGGIALMARDVVKTTNLSTSTDQVRQAFTRLDRQVRYASQVNYPGTAGGTRWYVEFLAPNGSGVPTCHQWRLDTAADVLQERFWPGPPAAAPGTAPTWVTVASTIANDPAANPPFTLVPADADSPQQGLVIRLLARKAARDTSTVTMETSLYARNSSTQSDANDDVDANGVSDTPICATFGRP